MSDYTAILEEEGMVGASAMFIQHGEIIAREHFGLADIATHRAVDENTIFHWGSITKTLTGVAIMQLRDRGLLSLDDPITDYVPELRQVHNPYGAMDDITLRHLLSHSAGFRGPTWPWGGSEPWHPHEPTRWEQVVAMLPYTQILFEPGSRYSYSNPGIIFLGQVIERLTGDDWEVYVDKNILKPLRMYRSYFDRTPYHLLKDRSNNYTVREGIPVANGLDFDTGITVSNGGLNAPLSDMALYMGFLFGASDPDGRFQEVLRRSSLEEMWIEEVSVGDDGRTRRAVGLTFFILEHDGATYVGHTGSQKAFFSFFYIHPPTGTAAIVALNSTGSSQDGPAPPNARALLNLLTERLLGEIFPLFR